MKFLIASDIHGSAYYCRLLIERLKEERADKLLLLGDLLYHGARNPLPKEYSTLEVAALLNGVKDQIICVKGNCDSEVDALVLEFPVAADFALLFAGGRTVVAAHGHREYAHLKKGDILLNGHFHVPAIEERESCTYINCGSVSVPKENSPRSYLVLEENKLVWKEVETGKPFKTAEL